MRKKPKEIPKIEEFKLFTDSYHVKIGELVFVIKTVKVINVGLDGQYGDPYTSVCDFDIIDGEAHVTGLMGKFKRTCFNTIKKFASLVNIKKANYLRKKKGKDNHKSVDTKG